MQGKQSELIAAAAAGRSLNAIAAVTGLSKSTVQRRLKDPEIAAEIDAVRSEQRYQAVQRMTSLRDGALTQLEQLLDHEDAGMRMRAISLALSTTAKNDLVADLEQRMLAMEAAATVPDELTVDEAAALVGARDEPLEFVTVD